MHYPIYVDMELELDSRIVEGGDEVSVLRAAGELEEAKLRNAIQVFLQQEFPSLSVTKLKVH